MHTSHLTTIFVVVVVVVVVVVAVVVVFNTVKTFDMKKNQRLSGKTLLTKTTTAPHIL